MSTEGTLVTDRRRSLGRFPGVALVGCWFLLINGLIAVASPTTAEDHPRAAGRDFHPLVAGTVWEYEVRENGEVKHQEVELQNGDDGEHWVLTTRTGLRRIHYAISRTEQGIYLHQVRYKLNLLPFSRTTTFDPPLLYLRFGTTDSLAWTWQGEAAGMGHEIQAASYRATFVSSGQDGPPDSTRADLVVQAAFVEAGGERWNQTAVYRSGVGLVSVSADHYVKRLVRWRSPDHPDWQPSPVASDP